MSGVQHYIGKILARGEAFHEGGACIVELGQTFALSGKDCCRPFVHSIVGAEQPLEKPVDALEMPEDRGFGNAGPGRYILERGRPGAILANDCGSRGYDGSLGLRIGPRGI